MDDLFGLRVPDVQHWFGAELASRHLCQIVTECHRQDIIVVQVKERLAIALDIVDDADPSRMVYYPVFIQVSEIVPAVF